MGFFSRRFFKGVARANAIAYRAARSSDPEASEEELCRRMLGTRPGLKEIDAEELIRAALEDAKGHEPLAPHVLLLAPQKLAMKRSGGAGRRWKPCHKSQNAALSFRVEARRSSERR